MSKLSHADESGHARMVDIGSKEITKRQATAQAVVELNRNTFALLQENKVVKGDVLAVARIAGIQAAKRTAQLIPLCHGIILDHVQIDFELDGTDNRVKIRSSVRCTSTTGVEMEALTACCVAALTIYDMLKGVQKDIRILDLFLLEKEGGRSGAYRRSDS